MIDVVYGGFCFYCFEGDDLCDVVVFVVYLFDDFGVIVLVEVDIDIGVFVVVWVGEVFEE